MLMELLSKLENQNELWVGGFVMTGVILILIGVKNVTLKELREYNLSHHNVRKIDELIAWGFFYIIFGILIAGGALIAFVL